MAFVFSQTCRLLAGALPVAAVLAFIGPAAMSAPLIGQNINSYGLAGAIDTPTAEMLPDGTFGATISYSDLGRRNTLVFQAMPRLTVALRYSRVNSADGTEESRDYIWDRSFDLRFQVLDEDRDGWRPAMAVGLQDFMGTGIYSAEYIVATKTLTPRLRVSAGLGWGRLASSGGMGKLFGSRPDPDDGLGGKPNTKEWFRGEVAPFVSATYQATEKLSITGEYSGDNYACETGMADECRRPDAWLDDSDELKNKINLGFTYHMGPNYQMGGYLLGGKHAGLQFSVALNPRVSPHPSGLEKAPAPVRPRPPVAADPDGWSGAWALDPTAQPAIQSALATALAKEGQTLEAMALSANRAEVRITNNRYIQQAEALGRTARLMTRALPPSVEVFVITSLGNGQPTSSVTLRRSDIERLENTESGQIAEVASLTDARIRPDDLVMTQGLYPRFRWRIAPYMMTSLFDPDKPYRLEVGPELKASYEMMPGLIISGALRQRLIGNMQKKAPLNKGMLAENRPSPEEYERGPDYDPVTNTPRVRSDTLMYMDNSKPTVPHLTLAWYARPSDTLYSRVTVGLLEQAYGGVSGELLWKPANSRLAFGAEVNRVRKRDFRNAFEFRDYEVTSGHVSAYYEFGHGFTGQLDVGRYLAGDTGATITLAREFANGWRIGAYATKTDMSADHFGEGSFDKGVTLSIPFGWAIGTPVRDRAEANMRSLNRDGGARLDVDGRLYDTVRDSHSGRIYQGWGRFWR